MTQLLPSVIETDRLILVPLDDETALHLIGGDSSCLDHVADWPHDDTVDGVRLRARGGLVWLVGLGGVVIGDCGTAGPVADRTVEIGFGLAESQRSRGFGTELVAALSDWLLAQSEIGSVVATTDVGNIASRCVLERAGFTAVGESDGVVRYRR